MRNKKINSFVTGVFLFSLLSKAIAQDATVLKTMEAEEGELHGVSISTAGTGYMGTGYVTGFDLESDYVTVIYVAEQRQLLELAIRYRSSANARIQNLILNDNHTFPIHFAQTQGDGFEEMSAGKYLFDKGENKIKIQSSWGYMDIDQFKIKEVIPNTFNISPTLVDPLANDQTQGVYDFLLANFGKVTISGQTEDTYDKINPMTGYHPLLRSFDFHSFTEGYPYGWADGDFAFEAKDLGQVDDAIAWYERTGKQGLVNFHWHWCSPSGGVPGVNTFYTEHTSFDVRLGVTPGTPEYDLIIRDIDAIAEQLSKLQAAGVPVLWRPLHEAGGTWFWWGAHGPEACLALYDMLYDRLQNHHGLHNLIWIWSTPESDWYPGNNKVDILGYDSYPGAYNYIPQKQMFDQLYELSNGEKILAMTENGPIPDIDHCYEVEAPWSFFMSWAELVFSQNEASHIADTYSHHQVMSFNDDFEIVTPPFQEEVLGMASARQNAWVYPNPSQGIVYFNDQSIEYVEILDLEGRLLFTKFVSHSTLDFSFLTAGVYLLKARSATTAKNTRIVIR